MSKILEKNSGLTGIVITLLLGVFSLILNIQSDILTITLVALFTGFVAGWIFDYLTRKLKRVTHKVFLPPLDNEFNKPFYDYFCNRISRAKKEFLVSGEGFSYAGKSGKEIGKMYQNAIEKAILSGTNVVRIQTERNISHQFQEDLKKLLKLGSENSNSGSFKLFVITDQQAIDLASVCVIDYNLNSVIELMLPFKNKVADHDEEVSLAGVGVFVKGNRSLAKKVRERFHKIQKERTTRVTLENFDDFFGERHMYFAFGSNMDYDQMKVRCESAIKVGVAFKENFELVFNRRGTIWWKEGVASIVPAYNKRVWGVLYSVSSHDMKKLDKLEDPIAYVREKTSVKLEKDQAREVSCFTYFAIPESVISISPNKQYLDKIIAGAKAAGIEPRYIHDLEKIPSVIGPAKKS